MDRGVFFSNVSPDSVVTLKSLVLMRHEIGRHCRASVVTDLNLRSQGVTLSSCSRVPKLQPGLRSWSEVVNLTDGV